MRRRAAGLAVAVVAMMAGCAAPVVYEAAMLPAELELCGRQWQRDVLDRRLSSVEIRAMQEVEPAVVERLDRCPPGACTEVAQAGGCYTVIYVRVGQDAYLGYSVQGGP
jgi:hypothetical protein